MGSNDTNADKTKITVRRLNALTLVSPYLSSFKKAILMDLHQVIQMNVIASFRLFQLTFLEGRAAVPYSIWVLSCMTD